MMIIKKTRIDEEFETITKKTKGIPSSATSYPSRQEGLLRGQKGRLLVESVEGWTEMKLLVVMLFFSGELAGREWVNSFCQPESCVGACHCVSLVMWLT